MSDNGVAIGDSIRRVLVLADMYIRVVSEIVLTLHSSSVVHQLESSFAEMMVVRPFITLMFLGVLYRDCSFGLDLAKNMAAIDSWFRLAEIQTVHAQTIRDSCSSLIFTIQDLEVPVTISLTVVLGFIMHLILPALRLDTHFGKNGYMIPRNGKTVSISRGSQRGYKR